MINYGIELYGSASSNILSKLQSKQNQLLKVLYNKDWLYGTNLLHHECKLIKVKDLYELRILSFVHKCLNKDTIPLFYDYFLYKRDLHSHNTRDDLNLTTIRSRTNYGDSRIKSMGPKLWNNNKIAKEHLDHSLETFKHNIKDNFIQQYI